MPLRSREPEIEAIGALLDRARQGEGGALVVRGEAGVIGASFASVNIA